ncbi:MAG TPA: DoxX family membrane protein [Pseudolabrys sp.]
MSDVNTLHRPAELGSGEAAMARLAERLTSLTPVMDLPTNSIMRPSPAVAAALATSAKIAQRAHDRARRSRSIIGLTVDSFISACAFVPYALVALALRLVMARVFFLDGQTKIIGVPVSLPDPVQNFSLQGFSLKAFNFSMLVPVDVAPGTIGLFMNKFAALPVSPVIAAYAVGYAEFILPVMLVLGFASRFAALGLLGLTALMFFIMPEALWTTHAYWAAILMVLISCGPGQISLDHIIRFIAKR